MKMVVLIDPEAWQPDDAQFEEGNEETVLDVEFHVTETLRELGHEVRVIPFDADIRTTIDALTEAAPDMVFNLTEHHAGERRMDKHIATLLELLRLRYTGAGPVGLTLCRDKALCKRLLSHHRIRVPRFIMLPIGKTSVPKRLAYPLMVKPGFEDGSDGISLASLARNEKDLAERVAMLHERMKQPVICEEFIEGREIYISITGNQRLHVYPAREVRFTNPDAGPQIATARVKLDEAYRRKWGIEFTDARLPEDLAARVARAGRRIYRLLQLRDYGRIDIRLTPEGQVVFLEANPNPDLTMGDEVAESARRDGVDYTQLIARILNLALRRGP